VDTRSIMNEAVEATMAKGSINQHLPKDLSGATFGRTGLVAGILSGTGLGVWLGSHMGIAVAGTAISGALPLAVVGAAIAGLLGRSVGERMRGD